MTIKSRLALLFTLLVAGILLFFLVLIDYFSYTNQLSKFRENLMIRAKNTATLLVNVVEVDSTLLKKIHQSTISWENEEIVITDSTFKIIWSNNAQYLSDSLIRVIGQTNNISFFRINEKDGIYYRHSFNNRNFKVYVMAFDRNRTENIKALRDIFFWSMIISLLLSIGLSYLFSFYAIRPISKIIDNIKSINATRLNKRLIIDNNKDEIGQLAATFNEMLADIEIAFKNQEEFVSNASHELQTPLAVMIAESDYFLNKSHSKEEYVRHINAIIDDLRKLNSLLFSLLEMAHMNRDNAIQLSYIRIDEVIFNAVHHNKAKYQGRKILMKILYSENENDLLVNGNAVLLEIAIRNLLDNACKFSKEDVTIEISILERAIKVIITDSGIGIPGSEIENIFKPFSRAGNVRMKAGFGIGLHIVYTIMRLHAAEIKVDSIENSGTRFEILFAKSENTGH